MDKQKRKLNWKCIIVVLLTYAISRYTVQILAYLIIGKDRFNAIPNNNLLVDGFNMLLCFSATYWLSGFSAKKMLEMLGLSKGLFPAFLVALIASLPHILGQQYLNGLNKGVTFSEIWFMGIRPGIVEEIFFRAFLAGLLVRYGGVPAIIPLLLSSMLFGIGHLYQAHSMSESLLVFLTAFGVGTGFYMFYKYANWNLWFPLFLHSFMDTATTVSNFSGNITMSGRENIFRGATILLGIAYCFYIQIKIRKAAKVNALITSNV